MRLTQTPPRPGRAPAAGRPGPSAGYRATPSGRTVAWARRVPLLPAIVLVIVVTQVPFLMTVWYSFQDWNLLTRPEPRFVGLANYGTIVSDTNFQQAALNTVVMTGGAVLLAFVAGLALALLVNRSFFGRGVVRTLLITPFLVLPAATALLWKTSMLNASFGLVNWVLRPFGVGDVDWVTQFPMLSVVVVLAWQWMPFMMLILLAGLQSEDPSVIEAGKVDGAGPIALFVHLTLPHLRQYAELGLFLGAVYIVQSFDVVYLMTQGGPGGATTNLPYFLYLRAFRGFEIGEAAALSVIVLIGTLLVATVALRVVSGLLKEEAKA
ncbi:carbohydrate ABC transporter permease [Pseudonocardia nigra]|uniref:carbohydrate ABC transporter permease n=1 Tax=Pseudonocardia nigra TaxID=1921578 RepID=UPI001C5E30E3|nr:sugar ABC transporter permease [Pseudonocardia nigra]